MRTNRNIIIVAAAVLTAACASTGTPDLETTLNGHQVLAWRSDGGETYRVQVIGRQNTPLESLDATLRRVSGELCGRIYSLSEPQEYYRGPVNRDRPFVSDPGDLAQPQRPPHAELELPAERWLEAELSCGVASD